MYIRKDIHNSLLIEAMLADRSKCFSWAKLFRECSHLLRRKDREIKRLRAALQGMIDNACAACDEDYVIRATKKEWDAHVKATAKARAALEGRT